MSSKMLHMNSTNFKIIIFISLLIIYLLVSDNIIERFTTTAATTVPVTTINPCPQIPIPVPTVVINSDSLFSDINEFIGRPSLIDNNKRRNLENVRKNLECAQNNYVKRVTKY